MSVIQCENHIVEFNSNNIRYNGNMDDITLDLIKGNQYTLILDYNGDEEYISNEKILMFEINSKHGKEYGHLKHLYIPKSIQGNGLGKLCIAIFYYYIEMNNIPMFSMKFGNGSDNYGFLKSLGFNDENIDTSKNEGQQNNSIVVGDYQSLGSRTNEWRLNPISTSEFPTNFFN